MAHANRKFFIPKLPRGGKDERKDIARSILVGARGLDVAGLLALVADTLAAGLSGAVSGNVANLAACSYISLKPET